ncbi:Fpg/Nei family DNA glycosylase [Streptomyces sp. NBC_00859]|uniref:Fpg/Nei family DNA glycosylase n=1 Tax=Streptomyces sp. NBC_00859 TaxID=2903682 RepID=UPI0038655AAB|nr:DNA glycosylase [Streptomyces sp. NBC_00859]
MPEGDSVHQAAQRLHTALAGHVLTRFDLRVPRFATADLTGRTVLDVTARGKHLLMRLEGGLTLHSHLRMDGSWKVYAPSERWRGGPAYEIRAVLGTAGPTAVGYRLPVLELLRTADESTVVGHLGPDLLGPDWDPGTALANLLADPVRPLMEALLDQRNLAGVGNVFAAEICFVLRAAPWLPVGRLPRPERAVTVAKRLLDANRDRPVRTTTGRPDQRLYVYGRAPRPCLRCGTSIRRAVRSERGSERPTYWCPQCQADPSSPADPTSSPAPPTDPSNTGNHRQHRYRSH